MARFWPGGDPAAVTLDEQGRPAVLSWHGRTHPVAEVAECWRVDVGWQRRRAWRDYARLVTRSGLLLLVYRDLVTDRWYVQRLYD